MGEPAPTVAKIKDIVYRGDTGEVETQSREEYLGEGYFWFAVCVSWFVVDVHLPASSSVIEIKSSPGYQLGPRDVF